MQGLFRHGGYSALEAEGARGEHVVSFARQHEARSIIVAVPRLTFTLLNGEPRLVRPEDWIGTGILAPEFAGRTYSNALSGDQVTVSSDGKLSCSKVFASFPAALLVE